MFSAIARTASCLVLVHIKIFIPVDIEFRSKTSAQRSRTLLDFIVKRSIKSNATMEAAEKSVIIGSNENGRCSRTSSRSNVDKINRPITLPIIR
jgi:hypothetical protein